MSTSAAVAVLIEPSGLPHGLPDFAAVEPEAYRPAFDEALRRHRAEIEAIASSPDEPTVENTLVALERSGRELRRVSAVFFTVGASDRTPLTDAVEEELAPLLSAHDDAITLDPRLYARVRSLADREATLDLDAETSYLLERVLLRFERAGALLDDAGKTRLSALNERLSSLTTRFDKNLLADTNERAVLLERAEELDGLDASEISAAARAATDRGADGYLVTLPLYSGHPWLARLRDRSVRERILRASLGRAGESGAHDDREVLLDIVALRAERAALLGHSSHAAFVISGQTAGTPERVRALLEELAIPAARNARAELEQMQQQADTEQDAAGRPRFMLEAWDRAFYEERVRTARYAVDSSALRPYFELERVLREGVFAAATGLYGVRFAERPDLVGHSAHVRVFEVAEEDGTPLGLFLFDPFTRDSKRGGAWMISLRTRTTLLGDSAVVVNTLNISAPGNGEPALLSLDEVETLFHEFGHALHGLFATTRYPRFGGTSVFRDFVEFPSQVNEMWIRHPELLPVYARHVETGEPLPAAVVEQLEAAALWGEGFATTEYLAAALLDLAWHETPASADRADVVEFETRALEAAGLLDPAIPPRYRSTYFKHVFSGGYSAGYYSYIWSEILDADTVEWFEENGGLDRAAGERFRRRILEIGGSRDPLVAYREFRGRDARTEPLLRRRGLA
ncbi:peptidyl-dipeptidase Dcp [Rathayibacter sp. PhB93]|uniref:M3 family metallopeptidase n=1 Tax=unclassified Rathayibacter TaxID=2609250 RepID=UPI000F47A364|nr:MULTISPECIES: M3 family metallopeptidase [unclassified Rathayibacter]ROQ06629.1 peptidyl-dipeptidase Dcp [Rathayibacter sp. PhB93]TDQ14386.1 peptidyl-dipeptidase Dcp [Rathayibacter sp. PhB1]